MRTLEYSRTIPLGTGPNCSTFSVVPKTVLEESNLGTPWFETILDFIVRNTDFEYVVTKKETTSHLLQARLRGAVVQFDDPKVAAPLAAPEILCPGIAAPRERNNEFFHGIGICEDVGNVKAVGLSTAEIAEASNNYQKILEDGAKIVGKTYKVVGLSGDDDNAFAHVSPNFGFDAAKEPDDTLDVIAMPRPTASVFPLGDILRTTPDERSAEVDVVAPRGPTTSPFPPFPPAPARGHRSPPVPFPSFNITRKN